MWRTQFANRRRER